MDRIYKSDCLRHYTAQELVDEYAPIALRHEMDNYSCRTSYVDLAIPFFMLISIGVMMLCSAWIGTGWMFFGIIVSLLFVSIGSLLVQEYFRRKYERSFNNWESQKALAIKALQWHCNGLANKLEESRIAGLKGAEKMKAFGLGVLPCDEYDTFVDSLNNINKLVDDYYRHKLQYVQRFVESDDFKNANPETVVSIVHSDLVALSYLIHGNINIQKLLQT